MRPKIDVQREIEFPTSGLALTREYYAKYEAISRILEENLGILALAHRDLEDALRSTSRAARAHGPWRFTSDNVLRVLIVQSIEGLSLRQTVVRIDDSPGLRQFTRASARSA